MSSRGTGISPDELILLETIERAKQFKVAVSEMIVINKKLEEATLAQKQQLNKSSNAYKMATNVVNYYSKQQRSAWAKVNKEAKKNINVYKAKNKTNIELKKSTASLTVEIKKQNIELDRLNKTSNKTGSSSLFKGLGGKLLGIGAAVAGFKAIKQEITDTINLIKKLESLKFTMSKIISDPEDLDRTMGRLMMLSEDFGVELISLTERYTNFLVAADQSNISLKDTESIFGTVTKAMSLMGKSTDETKGSLLAIEQMMSKGKITTEELRRQLGERLPGAMGIMADAVGVDIDQLDKMMKKGEVISAEVLPAFAREIEKTFGLDTIKTMDTLVAAQNRSANAWTNLWRTMEQGKGVFGNLLKKFERLKTYIYTIFTPFDKQIETQKYMPQGYEESKLALTEEAKNSFIKEGRDINKVTSKEMIEREKKLAPNALVRAKEEELKSWEKLSDLETDISDWKDDIIEIKEQADIDMENAKKNGERMAPISRQSKIDLDNVKKQIKEAEKYIKHYIRTNAVDVGWRQYLEDIVDETESKLNGGNGDDKTKKKTGKKAIEIIDEKELRLKKYSKFLLKIMQTELDYYNKMFGESETLEDIKEWGDAIMKQEQDINNVKKEIIFDEYEVKLQKDLDKIDKKIERIKGKIIKNENVIKHNSKINGADVVTPAKEIADGKRSIETLEKNRLLILKQSQKNIEDAKKLHEIEMSKIYNDSLVRDLNKFKQYLEDKDSINKSKQDALRDTELASLEDTYAKGLMSAETYERKKNEISVKYQIEKAKGELKRFVTLHNKMVAIGESEIDIKISSKTIEELKAKIKELELLLKKLAKKDSEFDVWIGEIDKFIAKYKDAFMGMADAIYQNAVAIHQAKIDMLQEEMDANTEMYAHHKELALDDAEQKRLIIREEEARRKKIQDKINKEKYEIAKKDKEYARFSTLINTSSAIINALTVKPFIAGLALSVMAATTGAYQLKEINKRKLPKYRKGTPKGGHQKDGFAIVGDGGIPEVIESKLGTFITPKTDTLVHLNKGDIVHKSINDYNNKNDVNTSPNLIEIDQNRLDKAISQGLSNAIIKNNITIVNDDYNAYKSTKLDI